MDSSSGVATVSAITLGLAPGYTVRTTTDGGTTSGYSLTGRLGSEIRPTAKMMIDNTAAKIGLSTKKREKFMAKDSCQPCRSTAALCRSLVTPGDRPTLINYGWATAMADCSSLLALMAT